ncbi:FAD:protein FMN transferase [Clostridium hydrogenum]|uniref:FAD:protein FMN transferase n=1 Tax=Clostridium hydrogenum TaxID=2855764 RepID=UPI001F1FEC88|nr:FAD:protein FMN transferase [Clostridium hydrogenum]
MSDFQVSEIICMGTNIIQKVYGENANKALLEVECKMRQIEDSMSFFKESSEIGRLNNSAGIKEVQLSEEVLYVLKAAKHFSEKSNGSFDVTAAPLIEAWGVFTRNERIPCNDEINEKLKLINYRDLEINEDKKTAKLLRRGQKVDLGAIAKGYAADAAIEIYKKNCVDGAFINLGGNVLVYGEKPDKSPWGIGIQNPLLKRGEIVGIVNVKNKSVVTSGDYVRFFEKGNVRYHHILDPKTGYPSNSGISSVTVISENSMESDALSTAAFVLGIYKGLELIENTLNAEAIFITDTKEIYVTEGIKEDFYFIEESGFKYN